MTERLDRIEAGIEQLNQTINTVVVNMIRPLTQQSEVNRKALAGLIEMVADSEVARIEQNQRIENMLSEAREDRRQSDDRFQAMQENIQRLFLEVRSTNVAVSGLGDRANSAEGRLDTLEQAS